MNKTGRAAVFLGPGAGFKIRDLPIVDPEPGSVLVRVMASNICGSDIHTWKGKTKIPNTDPDGYIFGHEAVGRICKLGTGINTDSLGNELQEGDRVAWTYFYPCGHCWFCLNGMMSSCPTRFTRIGPRTIKAPPYFTGTFAEYYYIRQGGYIFQVPESISDSIAATANCAASQVLSAISNIGIIVGKTALVVGVGGLGLLAIVALRQYGASRIIAIDRLDKRLEFAKSLGADHIFPSQANIDEQMAKQLTSLAGGRGADIIIETAGDSDLVSQCIPLLRSGGDLILLGCIVPERLVKLDPALIVAGNKRIWGMSNYEPGFLPKALQFLDEISGRYPIEELITHFYELEDINQAFVEADGALSGSVRGLFIRASILP